MIEKTFIMISSYYYLYCYTEYFMKTHQQLSKYFKQCFGKLIIDFK